jgi:hypothetical protein
MTKEMVAAASGIGRVAASTLYIRVPPVTCHVWRRADWGGDEHTLAMYLELEQVGVSGRGWLLGLYGALMLVMLGGMVVGDIVAKVFSPRVPQDINILVAGLVRDPKVAHFHRAGLLAFYSVVGNASHGVIVAVNGRRRLGMAHLFKDEAKNFDFLGIEEEDT